MAEGSYSLEKHHCQIVPTLPIKKIVVLLKDLEEALSLERLDRTIKFYSEYFSPEWSFDNQRRYSKSEIYLLDPELNSFEEIAEPNRLQSNYLLSLIDVHRVLISITKALDTSSVRERVT